MARKKKRRGGKNTMGKVFKVARLIAFGAPAGARIAQHRGDMSAALEDIVHDYTGYSMSGKNWHWSRLKNGWGPYLGVSVATYLIPKISGFIRRL